MIYTPQYEGRERFTRDSRDKAIGVVIYRRQNGNVVARFAPNQYRELTREYQQAARSCDPRRCE